MSKRKAYKPKPIHVPMMSESRNKLAMQLHGRVETLIQRPSIESFHEVNKIVATLIHAKVRGEAMERVITIMGLIVDRYERVNKVGVSDKEAEELRLLAGQLDVLLPTVPVNVLKASRAVIHYNFELLDEVEA